MREPTTISWAGGRENAFLLRIGEMIALEKACDAGIGRIWSRLISSLKGDPSFYMADVTETIRLGLIGGGMPREDAAKAVTSALDWHGALELLPVALSVLTASISGEGDDEEPDEAKKKAASTDGLTNTECTAAAP